jgi:hypothetical protein
MLAYDLAIGGATGPIAELRQDGSHGDILLGVVQVYKKNGTIRFEDAPSTGQYLGLGAFDIHFDEIGRMVFPLEDKIVQRERLDFRPSPGGFARFDAIACTQMGAVQEFGSSAMVPNSGLNAVDMIKAIQLHVFHQSLKKVRAGLKGINRPEAPTSFAIKSVCIP